MNDAREGGEIVVESDVLTPGLAGRFLAALGHDETPSLGDQAPWGSHWGLAPERAPTSALGPDGLSVGRGLLGKLDAPFKMWGGARLHFTAEPLRVGDMVERRSWASGCRQTTGRAGPMTILEISSTFSVDGVLRLTEVQTLIGFAEPPGHAAARTGAEGPADDRLLRRVTPDQAMLFYFSAVTFNPHRIHYDRPYATDVEGHADLVVHGPLTAALMLDALRRDSGPATAEVLIRAVGPAYCDRPLEIVRSHDGATALAIGPDGPVARAAIV